jgi:hypothetical protein
MSAQIIDLEERRRERFLREWNARNDYPNPKTLTLAPVKRCGVCRQPGHDRSSCTLHAEAFALAKKLGILYGEALARIKGVAQ